MTARQMRILKANGLMVVVATAIGVVAGLLLKTGHPPAAIMLAACVTLLAIGFAATIPYWRSIDDGAREAHKTAWYWGGSFGTGVGLLSAMVIGGGVLSPMARGALLTGGIQVVAYGVVWAGWWITRRSTAA